MDTELFKDELAALKRAQSVLEYADAEPSIYRQGLEELVQHYQRLMRETHRLIRHGDRTEAELTAVNARLQRLSAELDYKARHDPLTGTLNRAAIFDKAQRYLQEGSLSLILLDIDFFKRVNDSFGHPVGDEVLRELVERLNGVVAGRGEVGRVGGEEFTILLPHTPLRESADIAENIRHDIAARAFSCLPAHPVTASFGVSWSAPGTDFEVAYADTDAALYRAKNQGRNQVAC